MYYNPVPLGLCALARLWSALFFFFQAFGRSSIIKFNDKYILLAIKKR